MTHILFLVMLFFKIFFYDALLCYQSTTHLASSEMWPVKSVDTIAHYFRRKSKKEGKEALKAANVTQHVVLVLVSTIPFRFPLCESPLSILPDT